MLHFGSPAHVPAINLKQEIDEQDATELVEHLVPWWTPTEHRDVKHSIILSLQLGGITC